MEQPVQVLASFLMTAQIYSIDCSVQGMWIVPEESINKIGNNGVQRGSELYVDGLFYPGQETIPSNVSK